MASLKELNTKLQWCLQVANTIKKAPHPLTPLDLKIIFFQYRGPVTIGHIKFIFNFILQFRNLALAKFQKLTEAIPPIYLC